MFSGSLCNLSVKDTLDKAILGLPHDNTSVYDKVHCVQVSINKELQERLIEAPRIANAVSLPAVLGRGHPIGSPHAALPPAHAKLLTQ